MIKKGIEVEILLGDVPISEYNVNDKNDNGTISCFIPSEEGKVRG